MSDRLQSLLGRAAAGKQNSGGALPGPKNGNRTGAAAPPGPAGKGASLFNRLADLYARMEDAYNNAASRAGLSCADCEQNCCTSFFQHHTHIEWAYLWRGLNELPQARRDAVRERAACYVADARAALAAGALPSTMCPLNDEGLCTLYAHRLMICRMHGTRNSFTMPGGGVRIFPGCHRFVALQGDAGDEAPALDRTPFYKELAALEMEFCRRASGPLSKVDMTLAEMIVLGPPRFR